MKTIKISYNPYKMKTTMLVDGIDVCKNDTYAKFKNFIMQGTPLQTWIEPIPYFDWEGFVNELSEKDRNDEVKIEFSGRIIDFEDMQRAISSQNEEREERTRVLYHFEHKKKLDDKALSENIEAVVKDLKSDKFRALVKDRKGQALNQKYNDLEENYAVAKESEFYIVIAGVYSSGKSTFLNTLIKHTILPTSAKTCTSKNCRIRHDGSLGTKVSLACYDADNKLVGKKKIFENDSDCAAMFEEICPINDVNKEYEKVETMEIGVDLSHLYPDSVSKDKFTIVLIDTPGMDSAQSSKDGKNAHAEIALEAISMESKPMIILCADANKYEDKSIGEFMREIISQAKEDGGGFNDRFLFLMNKSDEIGYKNNESATDIKSEFAKYLTDSSKWNIKGGEDELKKWAENASHFVPRVFMIASLMAWAMQNKAHEYTRAELKEDSFKRKVYNDLDKFIKNVAVYEDENYYLSNLCDIPNYRKEKIAEEFEEALEKEDDVRAAELQSGFVSVESAIKDYIERYAYPVKVRGLLDTFEDILEDVDGFTNGIIADLEKAKKLLGEKSGEREEAEGKKEEANEKIALLNELKPKVIKQLDSLDGIVFDSTSLKAAIADFRADIDGDPVIIGIRTVDKVPTGQKSRSEVMEIIGQVTGSIEYTFNKAIYKTNAVLEKIKAKHDKQLYDIFDKLKKIVKELEESKIFKEGEYNFTKGIFWKGNLAKVSSDEFGEALRKKVVDKTFKNEQRHNSKKADWGSSWNPFKRIGSWFMDDYVTVSVSVDGYYENTELRKSIAAYVANMTKECNELETQFINITDGSKAEVVTMAERLLEEVQFFLEDIKKQKKRIKELSSSIDELNKAIARHSETQGWLGELKEKIKGE